MANGIFHFLILSLIAMGAWAQQNLRSPLNSEFHAFSDSQLLEAQKMLNQSLLFYNTYLRNPVTGQYIDAVSLAPEAGLENNSSVAATGMGLISLALADATGVIPNAREMAQQSLEYILDPKFSKRSSKGWFRHWFNADNGGDNSGSRGDGYSTIDTAILAAGAIMNANYFVSQNKDPDQKLQTMSQQLLNSVQWSTAISNIQLGTQYLAFDLNNESSRGMTAKFNEYVLVACMGKLSEQKQGKSGAMTQFWNMHFAGTSNLPKKTYYGSQGQISVLTDFPTHFLSSFTIQFAYYLCRDVNTSADYNQYFKNEMNADRDWFRSRNGGRAAYWGQGAGQALNSTYEANAIQNNDDMIVSPHIVAGFLPADASVLNDLFNMKNDQTCLYNKAEYQFLWRCSLKQPSQRLNRVQAIDFSTTFLGLAVSHPSIGREFYRRYSP